MAGTFKPARLRASALAMAVAGVLFVLYPVLRPFSDEATLAGAAAFASPNWLLSHVMAMLAFILVAFGLYGLLGVLPGRPEEPLGYRVFVLGLFGVGLLLPFYGAEAFGLQAVGQEALRQGSASLVGLAAVVRSGFGLFMFLLGLLMLGTAGVSAAVLLWRSSISSRWTGIPLALGLALYIPQFFGTQPVRVAHGVLVAIGCLWIAAALWKQAGRR